MVCRPKLVEISWDGSKCIKTKSTPEDQHRKSFNRIEPDFPQNAQNFVTLPAPQKTFVDFFWGLPGDFALKKAGDVW